MDFLTPTPEGERVLVSPLSPGRAFARFDGETMMRVARERHAGRRQSARRRGSPSTTTTTTRPCPRSTSGSRDWAEDAARAAREVRQSRRTAWPAGPQASPPGQVYKVGSAPIARTDGPITACTDWISRSCIARGRCGTSWRSSLCWWASASPV